MTSCPADQPEYACAVLAAGTGRILLHLRAGDATRAANQLTCFGGRREAGEDARTCLARELREELGWTPSLLGDMACDLRRGPRWIARFFHVALTVPISHLHPAPGHRPLAVPWKALPGLPVSPWHQQALAAIVRGVAEVQV
ncbi:MAG: NUDIX domain-containing protein [Planctomycetes bacterium]|nr:NUDIX domain-containing protein [Planctomycetota bacterium]